MAIISLYAEDQPRVYPLSWIYNPDVDGEDFSASGKIIPQVTSQIVDDTAGLHNQLYTVTAVDPVTHKVTMVPTSLVMTEDAQPDRVLSYGNDIYMLYYATVTIVDNLGVTQSLTRLVIDNKLAFFGHHGAQYELIRTKTDGTKISVSQAFSTSNKPLGSRVDVVETAVPGIRKCVNCYSYASFEDGEQITMYVYDAAGILIAQIALITKEALILNELSDSSNPIVKFDLLANQMLDDDIILYVNQPKEELAFYAEITYADGTTQIVGIDGTSGFLYGLDDVDSKNEDQTWTLTAKYYIDENTPANIAEGSTVRYLACHKKLRIVAASSYGISKISPIPMWDATTRSWSINLFGYKDSRSGMTILTQKGSIEGFDGTKFLERQTVTIKTTETPDSGNEQIYTQKFDIEVRDPELNYPNFLIKDDYAVETDPDYNSNIAPHISPVVHFGPVQVTDILGNNTFKNMYYIPQDLYKATSTQTQLDVFLENFYLNAQPPLIGQDSVPVTPTHFTVRSAGSGTVVLMEPKVIADFGNPMNLIGGADGQFCNSTVVVEFWKYNEDAQADDNEYDILYGVPVYVKDVRPTE